MKPAQRPAPGYEIRHRAGRVRRVRRAHDQNVVGQRREHGQLAFQNRLALDDQRSFVAAAEAPGLSAPRIAPLHTARRSYLYSGR